MKKIKKLLAVFICVAMVVAVMPGITVLAVRDSGDFGTFTWSVDTLTGTLTISGRGEMPDMNGSCFFAPWRDYLDEISFVVIEEGITSVADHFMGNYDDYLAKTEHGSHVDIIGVSLPSTLKSIGDSAFGNCIELKSVDLPANLTSIGDYAFGNCFSLETVAAGDKITQIGTGAFIECRALTEFHISERLTEIPSKCFENCARLQTVNIPDGIKKIGDEAFSGCASLESPWLPEGLVSIGRNAFADCSYFNIVNIPVTVAEIGFGAFWNCTGVSDIYYHSAYRLDYNFNNSRDDKYNNYSNFDYDKRGDVERIVFGPYVSYIPTAILDGNTNLSVVFLYNSVEEIGVNAFKDCPYISDIIYIGTTDDWNNIYIDRGNETLYNAEIHYVSDVDEAIALYENIVYGTPLDTTSQPDNGTGFTDIADVPWANEAINSLAAAGIVNGIGNGLFAPMDNVTRAQFVHMIVNAFGFTGNGVITFSDVNNQWFANSVLIAANNSLVSGYDGRFNPDDNITCQDAAVILKRVLDMKGVNLPAPVTTAETIGSDYALDAIGVLRANGVIKSEMGFSPFLYASRAQAAYMIYGAYKLYMGI